MPPSSGEQFKEEITMSTLKTSISTISLLIISLIFAMLVISPAGAMGQTQTAAGGSGTAAPGMGHHGMANATFQKERLQAELTKLGQSGVDVSKPQADLTAGNTAAARQWLMEYHKDHPDTATNKTRPPMMNATFQKERLQAELTRLGLTGVDVSVPQADLTAGNTAAARQWLMEYHKDHPVTDGIVNGRSFGNCTGLKDNGGFAGNHAGTGNRTHILRFVKNAVKNL
jgi:hypothetical protein